MPSLPGFVGGTFQNLSLPADAQSTINLFPEVLESGNGRSRAILIATPGKTAYTTLRDGPVRGQFAQDGRAWAVGGGALDELIANASTTARGSVAVDDNPVWFASNGSNANQMIITSGGTVYLYNLLTNTLTTPSFPSTQATCATFLDDYFLVLAANGTVFASAVGDGSTWSGTSFGKNSVTSDQTIALIADDHRTLWFMGTKTSVPWTDVGTQPFAFQPVPGAVMGKGAWGPAAVARFDNSLIFGGSDETGVRAVYMVVGGYNARRISSHGIERIWEGYSRVDDVIVWTYTEMGHAFAVFYFPTANATWVYDAASQMWHQRGLWNTGTAQFDADRGRAHCAFNGLHLVGDRASATIYRQDLNLYDDAGSPKRWLRRSPHLFNGSNRWNFGFKLELIMETGVGLITGQGSDPQVVLRWSDDMGRTYGNDRADSFGQQGDYRVRVQWYRLGRFRDRVWEVSGSDPVKTVLIDAIFEGEAEND